LHTPEEVILNYANCIKSHSGSSGQQCEYEAQLTLEQGCWRQTAASIQDPELQIPTSIIWEEETPASSFLFFKEFPHEEKVLLPIKGREPRFGSFLALRGFGFVPPTF